MNAELLDQGFWEKISAEDLRRKLAEGARVIAREEGGVTPLHIAVAWSGVDVARVLIEAGADIDASDQIGRTPLHIAAGTGKVEIVRELLEAGVDVNAQTEVETTWTLENGTGNDNDNTTALHMAAKDSNVDIVRMLLDAGADVNSRTSRGLTPLYYAAIWGNVETVKLLLDSGSDAKSLDKFGMTVLAYASESAREFIETDLGDRARTSCRESSENSLRLQDVGQKQHESVELKTKNGNACFDDENRNILLYWDEAPPPSDVTGVVDQWRNRSPNWNINLFDKGKAYRFLQDIYGGDVARTFLSCAIPVMRCDFFRNFWILSEGGVYSDMTFIPIREPAFFDTEKNITVVRRPNGTLTNNIFFAKKNCKEIQLFADELLRAVKMKKKGGVAKVTGPVAWRKTLWQRETSTMAIVDWKDVFGKYIKNSNYTSCTRGKKSHWIKMQKRIGLYREPLEQEVQKG